MTLLLVGLPLRVAAQDGGAALSIGYQYQRVPAGEIPVGFDVDVSAPLGTVVDIVGQFDWSRRREAGIQLTSTQTVSTFGGGIRWSRRGAAINPFFQLLAGVTRNSFHDTFSTVNTPEFAGRTVDSGGTMMMVQIGAGLAAPLNQRVSVVGELDYRPYIAHVGFGSARAVAGVRISLH